MRLRFKKLIFLALGTFFSLALLGALGLAGTYLYLVPRLPSIETLKDVRLQVPLRVYAAGGELIAEFGEMKRTPVRYENIPEPLVQAVLAAEDDRFFEHPGVDYQGLLRAAANLILTGERSQGGSTITMQVARNFFLSREKTYLRKLNEIFLSFKIENELSKHEILELYLNKIYLGNRAYGVAAAAQVYYGKDIENLSLPQVAMIAGLPKAPSRYNPIADPERAVLRRNYVLGRMHALGFIGEEAYRNAVATPDDAYLHSQALEVEAAYVAEMVRADMVARYGNEAYTDGYRVYTTLDARLQRAATRALRSTLAAYDRRHGYRGPESRWDPLDVATPEEWDAQLDQVPAFGGLRAGVVVDVEEDSALVYIGRGRLVRLPWVGIEWARRYLDENTRGPAPETAGDVLAPGDVVRVAEQDGCWRLEQVPAVSGALVSLRPDDGAIVALVGGFDYYLSKFNRAVQAERQPGSSFKPFIYSAALDNGFTAATLVNDAPVVFDDPGLEATWRPENYSGRFYGPTRLREALVNSRNLVSIRVLRAIGIGTAVRYARRFGFDSRRLPRDLSLALGSGAITPLELTAGYAVFANGGYRVQPYFIQRIEDAMGTVIEQANPPRVCPECEQTPPGVQPVNLPAEQPATVEEPLAELPVPAKRVLSAETAYLMSSMLRDVIRRGTGRGALQLGRNDIGGKTGTTNDQRDAWFAGFNRDLVATAWVGFDTPRPLGHGETGARAALPMWREYMREALAGQPEHALEQPPGLVTVRIDAESGEPAGADDRNAVFETFRADQAPQLQPSHNAPATGGAARSPGAIPEQLF